MDQRIEMLPVAELTAYAKNSRTHSPAQVKQIEASIREFGFTNPILVDGTGGVIAGHGRLLAAKNMGLDVVPCLRLSHLTEAQKRAYVIADNKLAENAGWDMDILKLEIGDLSKMNFDINLTGFELEDIPLADESTKLAPLDTSPPPRRSWVLIGIPLVRFGEIQGYIDSMSLLDDVVVQTTVTD